jgi:hypothetical protein
MPNLNPGPFAHSEILSQIRPDLLLAWLWPARDYLARRGLVLPRPDAPAPVNSEALAAIFLDPTPDLPPDLADSLYLFREMATPEGMDAILAAARAAGLELGLGEEASPADVALRAWVLDRQLLQRWHNRLEVKRSRAFKYYSTDANPPPALDGPTPEQLAALEQRLNAFFRAWKRGGGARVFFYRFQSEWVFIVRHGAPCRREGAMKDDQPTSICYRPQRHDLLIYDPARGQMRLNCCAERERRVLLRAFGLCLFGRADYFPGTAKYTLAPLRSGRACLACADVPGIERVTLTEVELHVREEPRHRIIRKARDIFALVENGSLVWPAQLDAIARATFEVKFWRAPRPRRLTLVPSNRALYSREEDSRLLDKLLQVRKFIEDDTLDTLTA